MIITSINVVIYNVFSSEVDFRPLIFAPKCAVHKMHGCCMANMD